MTHNQIAYWQLQETKQHNAATRAETSRTNRANEALKHNSNVETQRHNTVVEAIDQYNAREKARANRANEGETHRSNVAREYETNRHNLAQEGFADREVSVKEALLPSEIARNYGSAVGTGSKLLTGLAGVLGAGGPLFALYSAKKKNNNTDSSNNSGGGSGTKQQPVTVSTKPSKVRVLFPTNEKLGDYVNRRIQEENKPTRSGKVGNLTNGNKNRTDGYDRSRSSGNPVVDAIGNAIITGGTRALLGPYLGPAASGVAAVAPYAMNKLADLIIP